MNTRRTSLAQYMKSNHVYLKDGYAVGWKESNVYWIWFAVPRGEARTFVVDTSVVDVGNIIELEQENFMVESLNLFKRASAGTIELRRL